MDALMPSTQASDNNLQAVASGVEVQNTVQPTFTNYKNILQQYAQKSHLLIPSYEVVNEGFGHAPQFRATVLVGEKHYTSPDTFTQRKAAEQDAAKFALDNIAPIQKDEELPNIHEYAFFCKSILYEFARKMNLEKPTYNTFQPDALLHAFKSVITFNGINYIGEAGRNKKDAEQLAACAAILALLESELKNAISEIIKSKARLYAKLNKVRDSSHFSTSHSLDGMSSEKGVLMNNVDGSSTSGLAIVSSAQAANPPYHNLKNPAVESPTVSITQQKVSMPPSTEQGVSINNDDASSQSCGLGQVSSAQVETLPYHKLKIPVVESSTEQGVSINNDDASSLSGLVQVSNAQVATPPYHKLKNPVVESSMVSITPGMVSVPPSTGKGVLMNNDGGSSHSGVQVASAQVAYPPCHEFNKPVVQSSMVGITQPMVFVPPSVQRYVQYVESCGQKRRRNNKKKAKKHAQVGAQAPVALMHPSQVTSYPMAQ